MDKSLTASLLSRCCNSRGLPKGSLLAAAARVTADQFARKSNGLDLPCPFSIDSAEEHVDGVADHLFDGLANDGQWRIHERRKTKAHRGIKKTGLIRHGQPFAHASKVGGISEANSAQNTVFLPLQLVDKPFRIINRLLRNHLHTVEVAGINLAMT